MTSQLGLIGSHMYSILGAYALPAGATYGLATAVNLLLIRNPWGKGEWTGAYNDADVFWTNNPLVATALGFAKKDDGSFFITDNDFKTYFYNVNYTVDTTNLVRTSWVQIGNADTFGVAGTSTYCGAGCKMNTFTIRNTSATPLTYYLIAGTHRSREYGYRIGAPTIYTDINGTSKCNAPFVAGKIGTTTSSA